MDNALCRDAYNLNMFTILEVANSELQLSVQETLYITEHQPILCEQKEFYNLLLFNLIDYTTTKQDLVKEKTKENHQSF